MRINEVCREVYNDAIRKGWHDNDSNHSPLEQHALFHSEISEATEEVRRGNPPLYFKDLIKPQGEAVELADVVIRIMDYFAYNGWDLEKVIRYKIDYNRTREYRHGGKLY